LPHKRAKSQSNSFIKIHKGVNKIYVKQRTVLKKESDKSVIIQGKKENNKQKKNRPETACGYHNFRMPSNKVLKDSIQDKVNRKPNKK